MTRPELEAEFRRLLGDVPEALVRCLLGAASEYAAGQVEKYARPYPWPPKQETRGSRRPA